MRSDQQPQPNRRRPSTAPAQPICAQREADITSRHWPRFADGRAAYQHLLNVPTVPKTVGEAYRIGMEWAEHLHELATIAKAEQAAGDTYGVRVLQLAVEDICTALALHRETGEKLGLPGVAFPSVCTGFWQTIFDLMVGRPLEETPLDGAAAHADFRRVMRMAKPGKQRRRRAGMEGQ